MSPQRFLKNSKLGFAIFASVLFGFLLLTTGHNSIELSDHFRNDLPIHDVEFEYYAGLMVYSQFLSTEIRIFDVENMQPVAAIAGGMIAGQVWYSDIRDTLAYSSTNGTVTLVMDPLNSNGSEPRVHFFDRFATVIDLVISPNGEYVAAAYDDNSIIIWDINSSTQVVNMNIHDVTNTFCSPCYPRDIAFNSNSNMLYFIGDTSTRQTSIYKIEIENPKVLLTVRRITEANYVNLVVTDHDIIATRSDNKIDLITGNGDLLRTYSRHYGNITGLHVGESSVFVSLDQTGLLKIWRDGLRHRSVDLNPLDEYSTKDFSVHRVFWESPTKIIVMADDDILKIDIEDLKVDPLFPYFLQLAGFLVTLSVLMLRLTSWMDPSINREDRKQLQKDPIFRGKIQTISKWSGSTVVFVSILIPARDIVSAMFEVSFRYFISGTLIILSLLSIYKVVTGKLTVQVDKTEVIDQKSKRLWERILIVCTTSIVYTLFYYVLKIQNMNRSTLYMELVSTTSLTGNQFGVTQSISMLIVTVSVVIFLLGISALAGRLLLIYFSRNLSNTQRSE